MMNFRHATRVSGVVAAGAIAALLITGCSRGGDGGTGEADAPSPGITDTTLTLGISAPLSGPTAGPGSCTVAGLLSYLGAKNADGGFEFGDGMTREVTLEYLDDTYDPAKTVTNFRQLVDQDEIFAYVGALGTPTNSAIMPLANEEEIPQVLLITGATKFSSDQDANPWTMGLLPTYYDEGFAFGQLLVERGEVSVAVLAQNDDYGDDYVAGLEAAIEGTDVEIVASATYEPTDTTLDGQVTELAASGADALLSAVSVTPLQIGVLTKAQSLGWFPEIFLPSNTSTPATVVVPGNGAAYPAVYSTSLSKVPVSPAFADDEDVIAYNEAFAEYGASIAANFTPHCAWSYAEGAILEQAFLKMTEPTRANFMEALRSIEDFQAPLLLDGITVNTTDPTLPAIQDLTLVQFNGQGYGPIQ